MNRDEIRDKYASLIRDRDNASEEDFQKLHQICPHPYGDINYEVGCWMCPDCGLKKQQEKK